VAGEAMVASINDQKARAFFHQAMLVKKDKSDADSDLELSVIAERSVRLPSSLLPLAQKSSL
jgi:hypothetical protein